MSQALLIAEDDADLCEIYRTFLARHGYVVRTAADGLECLEKLREIRPAVLVLDLELRWGGGDGVLARLREEHPKSGLPVVLTATAGSPKHMTAFIEPPVVNCLLKPFSLMALLESVRTAVGIE